MADDQSKPMSKFEAKNVPEHRLELLKKILNNDKCINIDQVSEGNGTFTVTAICPLRNE